jgi:hypothetical protein
LGEPSGPAAEYWFYNYWAEIDQYRTGLAAILISMLLVQILILITSLLHIFTKKRPFAVALVILGSIVITLMIGVNNSVSHLWSNSFDFGYVFAFPSLLIWVLISILSYAWKRAL